MHKVLVVDDDLVLQQSLRKSLEYQHFDVNVASSGIEAVNLVCKNNYDLVVMDVNMPGMSGLEALVEIKKNNPATIVIILTAYSNVNDAVKAVKDGAYNYLEKPIKLENLIALIKRAIKARTLVETMIFSAPTLSLGEKNKEDKFIGESNVMKKVFNIIERLAKVATPVLIRGETGTGKELVAKAIHFNGPRKDEKFVTINCGAIPDNLIESELFGHERGAFTGAIERKIGKFQFADGGTIFLDEIGDISLPMQIKLLRVLQEKTFTPLGSNRDINVDVRVIAASHKNFEELIVQGLFREDLFYRLNVLPVYLPPLRARIEDINHLLTYYINYFNKVHHLNIKGVSEEALKILLNYSWPGNIRELRNVIEHAYIMESTDIINISSFPTSLLNTTINLINKIDSNQNLKFDSSNNDSNNENEINNNGSKYSENETQEYSLSNHNEIIDFEQIQEDILNENHLTENENNLGFSIKFNENLDGQSLDFQLAKDMFERDFIKQALKFNKGKINKTALSSNIPKKTLLRKIEKYKISPKDFYIIK
jgi:DNA-binding NtrC family response regulator